MKDAYYFSHDSNARNDQRIIKLRREMGAEGYGIYWMIIEILREQENYSLGIDDDSIHNLAFDLRVDYGKIEEVILRYDLFQRDDDLFYSRSLKNRMERLDLIKQKRREAGAKGGKSQAKAKQMLSNSKASKVSKVKQSNNSKIITIDFSQFWELYDYKKGDKSKLLNKWNGFSDEIRQDIMDTLPAYIASTPDKKYRKHPQTYLNNKSWEDEIIIAVNIDNYRLDSTGNAYIAYCDKCHRSDFYGRDELNYESRCCQGKLSPERAVV